MLASIPAPGGGGDSGLAWAEGTLWVGQYRERKIHQVDPETGKVLRTIQSNRFVTGVTWVDGELWHGTWEGDESDLRRIDPQTGEVLERIEMPRGVTVSGPRIRRRRPVLLRRRNERQGESRAPAEQCRRGDRAQRDEMKIADQWDASSAGANAADPLPTTGSSTPNR